PQRRRALGRAARRRALAFTPDRVVDAYERLYARLAGDEEAPLMGRRPDPAPLGPRLRGAVEAGRVLAGGRLRTPGAIVLAYHDVGDDSANKTDYYVSPRQLRAQLTAARAWGLRFVDLAELTEAVASGEDLDGMAAVVFDDSLAGVHHHALPVLLDLGVPATVFAVSDALGTSPPWWPGAARVMTRAELEEMAALGFRVASHTRTHPSLPPLGARRQADELAGSRAALEDVTGGPVELFAYPYGHYDPGVRAAVADAGYRAGYSFLNGRITAGMDRFRLPRLNMWPGQGPARLAYHVARPPASWPCPEPDTVLHRDEKGGPGS
ncbi:MAG TPA: polysaccharide deacetylase family protein, partial [Acidimicrobiales bacterium]|nr:polysaccharide deacetylase family protein [Acidimicrobiales bacterium]